jgi:hypothetical protein
MPTGITELGARGRSEWVASIFAAVRFQVCGMVRTEGSFQGCQLGHAVQVDRGRIDVCPPAVRAQVRKGRLH